jgi:hypothetical protein
MSRINAAPKAAQPLLEGVEKHGSQVDVMDPTGDRRRRQRQSCRRWSPARNYQTSTCAMSTACGCASPASTMHRSKRATGYTTGRLAAAPTVTHL